MIEKKERDRDYLDNKIGLTTRSTTQWQTTSVDRDSAGDNVVVRRITRGRNALGLRACKSGSARKRNRGCSLKMRALRVRKSPGSKPKRFSREFGTGGLIFGGPEAKELECHAISGVATLSDVIGPLQGKDFKGVIDEAQLCLGRARLKVQDASARAATAWCHRQSFYSGPGFWKNMGMPGHLGDERRGTVQKFAGSCRCCESEK